MLNNEEEYRLMAEAEPTLWWYRTLHRLVEASIRTYAPPHPRILDIPCGSGGLLQYLKNRGFSKTEGIDVSPTALKFCKQRNLDASEGDLRTVGSRFAEDCFDVVICNDGLYFFPLKDQVLIVNQFFKLLKPNGIVCANFPARRIFRGSHDTQVGILRRTESQDLVELFPSEQFQVLRLTSWPFLLSPLILLARAIQRLRRWCGHPAQRSDVEVPAAPINFAFGTLCRIETALIRNAPFGSSMFVVARKRSIAESA
ncbi:MAG: class I SAM-dependent methyltransferase [Deltaproteobacteria bacterium]|nr:class I SAM-dependent methyltransferase [Deltaproteobacteria bacterium]